MAVDAAKEGVDPASRAHEDERRVPPPTRGVADAIGSDATAVTDHPPASVPEQAGRLPASARLHLPDKISRSMLRLQQIQAIRISP